jgi:hypothetical protein
VSALENNIIKMGVVYRFIIQPPVIPQTWGIFKSGGHPQFPRSFRGRTPRTPPNPLFDKEGEEAKLEGAFKTSNPL